MQLRYFCHRNRSCIIIASQRPRKHQPAAAAWCVSPSPAAVWRAQLDEEAPAASITILEPRCGRASPLLLSSVDKRWLRTQSSPGSHSRHAWSQEPRFLSLFCREVGSLSAGQGRCVTSGMRRGSCRLPGRIGVLQMWERSLQQCYDAWKPGLWKQECGEGSATRPSLTLLWATFSKFHMSGSQEPEHAF